MITIATQEHAEAVIPRLRRSDALTKHGNLSPREIVDKSMNGSTAVWAWLVNGQVGCLFGLYSPSMINASVVVWALTTDLVETHFRQFLRDSRAVVAVWHQMNPLLEGYVDAEFTDSVKWLDWLGFKLGPVDESFIPGLKLHHFEMR